MPKTPPAEHTQPTPTDPDPIVRISAREAWSQPTTSPALRAPPPNAAIEGAARTDPEAPPATSRQLAQARRVYGKERKQLVSLRLDADVLAAYRAAGPGWQSRMNAVLAAGVPNQTLDAEAVAREFEVLARRAAALARALGGGEDR